MITKHQQRVLAAIHLLEMRWDVHWWTRGAIGEIVGAGGFHRVIQLQTMMALAEEGLVEQEADSFIDSTRAQVRCSCSLHHWGLTTRGRERLADQPPIRMTDELRKRLERAEVHAINWFEDARGDRSND